MTTLRYVPAVLLALLALPGCGESDAPQQPAATSASATASMFPSKRIDAAPPYIVQEGCTFWLVTPSGGASTTSERGSGPSGTATLSWAGHTLGVSDCAISANPGNLPVY